jgi:hypothetical protein
MEGQQHRSARYRTHRYGDSVVKVVDREPPDLDRTSDLIHYEHAVTADTTLPTCSLRY